MHRGPCRLLETRGWFLTMRCKSSLRRRLLLTLLPAFMVAATSAQVLPERRSSEECWQALYPVSSLFRADQAIQLVLARYMTPFPVTESSRLLDSSISVVASARNLLTDFRKPSVSWCYPYLSNLIRSALATEITPRSELLFPDLSITYHEDGPVLAVTVGHRRKIKKVLDIKEKTSEWFSPFALPAIEYFDDRGYVGTVRGLVDRHRRTVSHDR